MDTVTTFRFARVELTRAHRPPYADIHYAHDHHPLANRGKHLLSLYLELSCTISFSTASHARGCGYRSGSHPSPVRYPFSSIGAICFSSTCFNPIGNSALLPIGPDGAPVPDALAPPTHVRRRQYRTAPSSLHEPGALVAYTSITQRNMDPATYSRAGWVLDAWSRSIVDGVGDRGGLEVRLGRAERAHLVLFFLAAPDVSTGDGVASA
eukprot:3904019-Rhodomonas_salina.6